MSKSKFTFQSIFLEDLERIAILVTIGRMRYLLASRIIHKNLKMSKEVILAQDYDPILKIIKDLNINGLDDDIKQFFGLIPCTNGAYPIAHIVEQELNMQAVMVN